MSFVLSGIPESDAIKFATINGAKAMHAGDYLGSIESGKIADLVVLKGNPLEDIRNTRNTVLVMKMARHTTRGTCLSLLKEQ